MIRRLLRNTYDYLRPIQISGQGNSFTSESKSGSIFRIKLNGNNNRISIGENCLLGSADIRIWGDNNQLILDDNVRLMGPCVVYLTGGGILHIKYNAGIRESVFNIEGGKIEIGESCMFAKNIIIRNHDSHKILDPITNEILNTYKDVIIGNHVWIAQNATILKGCHIGDNSIIGYGSVVTKSCNSGSIMAGNPARVVKEGITWDY